MGLTLTYPCRSLIVEHYPGFCIRATRKSSSRANVGGHESLTRTLWYRPPSYTAHRPSVRPPVFAPFFTTSTCLSLMSRAAKIISSVSGVRVCTRLIDLYCSIAAIAAVLWWFGIYELIFPLQSLRLCFESVMSDLFEFEPLFPRAQ